MATSLGEVGFGSVVDVMATYAAQASDLQPWLQGAEINTDRNLRLQYIAGLQLNQYQAAEIYNQILSYRTFPEDRFIAAPAVKDALRQRFGY